MPLDDERTFMERHYGLTRGPINRRAANRLMIAFVVAVLAVGVIIVIGALLTG